MKSSDTQAIVAALRDGMALLHPTDTVPGLGCSPFSSGGKAAIESFKQRQSLPFVHLIAHAQMAHQVWQPLSACWERALAKLWPGSLTVVWQARDQTMLTLGDDQSLGLRCAPLQPWLRDVIHMLGGPLTSTSVNISGQPHARKWQDAVEMVRSANRIFFPEGVTPPSLEPETALPSTVMRITGEASFEILRPGPVSEACIRGALNK